MPAIYLNKTHPGLFKAVLGLAVTHVAIGGLMLYGLLTTPASTHHNPALGLAFISAFFVIAAIQLYGLYAPHYAWVRIGLIFGLALIGFLALVFGLSIGLKLSSTQTKQLAWLFPPWGLLAGAHYLCITEPPINPSTASLKGE
jgi:hypothetical protein